jgi:hypothetical protein
VIRSGRQDCPVLNGLLKDWDNRLTVLLRKRVNRHIDHCPVCAGRRRREMTPAMFLGAAPIAGLSLTAGLPAGLRDRVLRAAAGNSPAATAHGGAAAAQTAYPFGPHGFPRPLDPPAPRWPRPRPVHAGAVAGTTAAVALGVTLVAVPPRPGPHPALGPTAGATGGAGPAVSWPAARRADSTAKAGVISGGLGSPTSPTPRPASAPTPTPVSGSGSASGSGAASAPVTASAPTSATSPAPAASTSTAPATGTLSVSPTTLDVTPPATGTITLTASGGPVDWSVSEPPGLKKKVVVSPMSGTLAAGATGTVSVTVDGPGKMHVHLVFSPGGTTVTVVVG